MTSTSVGKTLPSKPKEKLPASLALIWSSLMSTVPEGNRYKTEKVQPFTHLSSRDDDPTTTDDEALHGIISPLLSLTLLHISILPLFAPINSCCCCSLARSWSARRISTLAVRLLPRRRCCCWPSGPVLMRRFSFINNHLFGRRFPTTDENLEKNKPPWVKRAKQKKKTKPTQFFPFSTPPFMCPHFADWY